jgi:hypothetical protein
MHCGNSKGYRLGKKVTETTGDNLLRETVAESLREKNVGMGI